MKCHRHTINPGDLVSFRDACVVAGGEVYRLLGDELGLEYHDALFDMSVNQTMLVIAVINERNPKLHLKGNRICVLSNGRRIAWTRQQNLIRRRTCFQNFQATS